MFGLMTVVSGYLWRSEISDQKLWIEKNPIISKSDTKEIDTGIIGTNTYTALPNHQSPITNHTIKSQKSPPKPLNPHTTTTSTPPDINPEEIFEASITLEINDLTLPLPYFDSMTAEDAMREAMERYPDKFSYSGTTYGPGLGTFVKEINGIAENYTDKMHWILYINGKKSNKGISSLTLNPGDIIKWNYEKEIL